MSGSTDDALAKVDSAEAWSEFCDLLKQAGDVILREDLPTSTFDRGEGHRYLGRLLRAGLAAHGENTGSRHPVFRAMPENVKMGLDNPDNFYLSASVSPRYRYRIRGNRGTIHYLSFAAQNQNFAAHDRISGGAGHLEDSGLEKAADGGFEIIASTEEQPGNWLRMNEDTSMILVRQTYLDRSRETAVLPEIECLDVDEPLAPLDPAKVPDQLLGAAMHTLGAATWFANWVVEFLEFASMNEFHLPDEEKHRVLGGDPNVRLVLGRWQLADDEALVIDAAPPTCHYWNFQLGNIWAESLDYRFRRVHINSGQAETNADGTFRIVVAASDPGTPNWIDTAGHDHGTMGLRWVRADSHPIPTCTVVKLAELRG